MIYLMENSFCIIPVRGGSKGLPRKNLLKIYKNLSLLEWTIYQAKKVYKCEKIIVSTEDQKLKHLANASNVRVIDRPANLAKDTSSTLSVIDHLFEIFESEEILVDSFTILQVTSPLRDSKNIRESLELINSNKYDSVLSVYKDDKHPAKNYFNVDGFLEPVIPNYEFLPRQSLPQVYRRNGAIFSVKSEYYKNNKKLWGGKIGYVLMDKERSIDIDYYDDFIKAKEFIKKNIKDF